MSLHSKPDPFQYRENEYGQLSVVKPKPKLSLKPILMDADNLMKQLKLPADKKRGKLCGWFYFWLDEKVAPAFVSSRGA